MYGKKYFNEWIKNAEKEEIEIHIWVQILYDGNWLNPIINGKKLNNNLLNTKIEEISEIANIPAMIIAKLSSLFSNLFIV